MYIIRSMSTTDFDHRDPKPVEKYHIYLLPRHARNGAFWARYGYQKFDTVQDAIKEALASKIDGFQIVDVNDKSKYWDTYERMNRRGWHAERFNHMGRPHGGQFSRS